MNMNEDIEKISLIESHTYANDEDLVRETVKKIREPSNSLLARDAPSMNIPHYRVISARRGWKGTFGRLLEGSWRFLIEWLYSRI
ncbi:hypothetical protein FRB98_005948 [Tulasnella sp. 332]|nr:hypothetical protein FRB98_005948 [Tulasnella sp. 332]